MYVGRKPHEPKFSSINVGQLFSAAWVNLASASTFTSQLPVEHWHAWIGDATMPMPS